jgi:hypothetical protein
MGCVRTLPLGAGHSPSHTRRSPAAAAGLPASCSALPAVTGARYLPVGGIRQHGLDRPRRGALIARSHAENGAYRRLPPGEAASHTKMGPGARPSRAVGGRPHGRSVRRRLLCSRPEEMCGGAGAGGGGRESLMALSSSVPACCVHLGAKDRQGPGVLPRTLFRFCREGISIDRI